MYNRSKCVGASDAVHIQAGKWAELYDTKTGKKAEIRPEWALAASIGRVCENLNKKLFEEATGLVAGHGCSPDDPYTLGTFANGTGELWYTYLPDALIDNGHDDRIIPFEAKAINMMWQPTNLLKKYMPQLQHAMRVMSAPYCYFSVIYLNIKYEYHKIPYDEPYADALFEKEKLFYWHLVEGIRPPEYLGKRKGWT